jgi:hypothetical protein
LFTKGVTEECPVLGILIKTLKQISFGNSPGFDLAIFYHGFFFNGALGEILGIFFQ